VSSMQDQAQEALRATEQVARQAIDNIPPEAWPLIDLMMRITVGLAAAWLVLAMIAWWRRRAYNLTIASTASRNKKAQPGFLTVDHEARADAIGRGEAHDEALGEREADEALAALKAAAGPVTMLSRIARLATLGMSVITLLTGFSGAIFNISKMGEYVEEASAVGRLELVITQHPVGTAVTVFVVAYSIWRFITDKKWEKA